MAKNKSYGKAHKMEVNRDISEGWKAVISMLYILLKKFFC